MTSAENNRDEPNPNTSTVANRAGQDRIGGKAESLKGGGLLIHADLFAQTDFHLFCLH